MPATARRSGASCAPRRSGSRACSSGSCRTRARRSAWSRWCGWGDSVGLMPAEGEAIGVLALMRLQRSRRDARVDAGGRLVRLADQDRARWDRDAIEEGIALVRRAWRLGRGGKYLLQASIAAEHARGSNWEAIVWLYDRLMEVSPSAVAALNRAAAVGELRGPEAGLALMDALAGDLREYHLLHAARADMLRRLGRSAEAAAAYREALARTDSPV